MEFRGGEVKVAISGVDDAVASPAPPVARVVVPAAPPIDHSFSRDTSDDTEPVSIGDLEALFQPGHAPPSWNDPAGPASSERAPISAAIESSPSSFQPVSERDLVLESDRPRAAPPPPAMKRKPSFFDTDGAPAPLARLFDAAPAPFDPTVPALPVRLDPPDLPDDYRDLNSDSGLLDIRSLVARDGAQHPPMRREENRVDDDIFNLSGGLFAAGSGGPLAAPDLSALIAPVLPESTRPGPLTAPKRAAPQRASATAATSIDTASAGASAPVVSERRASPAATEASGRSSRAGWAVAAVLGAGLLLVSIKLGKSSTTTTVMAVETASPPIAVAQTAKPAIASPVAATPPAASAEPAAAAIDPGSRGAHSKDTVAAIPGAAAPRSTAPTTAVVAPVAAAPVVTTPAIPAPPPPPSAGAEFDQGAARAALAAAAGRAVGCKQPDDPSGGATVSVTFAPSGRVTSSKVTSAPFQGTVMGGCIASAFRSASVPPFEGAPITVTKSVSIR